MHEMSSHLQKFWVLSLGGSTTQNDHIYSKLKLIRKFQLLISDKKWLDHFNKS
jgi:hypothetical protein